MKRLSRVFGLLFSLCFLAPAQAVLIDRGTGMIYDTNLGITWLQDANYAQTSGYDGDGKMTWEQANAWAAGLNYSGYAGWRLQNGGNLPSGGELGYMYFNNLQGTSGPFNNLQNDYYWSSNEYPEYSQFAYVFNFSPTTDNHAQIFTFKTSEVFAWAVRDGDTGPSASVDSPFYTTMLLGQTISFDYFWMMGVDPPFYSGQSFDVLALQGGAGWQYIGQIAAYNSSSDWLTAMIAVPQQFWGLETQIRLVLSDFGPGTDPTVYLRNISSNTAPVPEPASILLFGTGLAFYGAFRKMKFKKV